MTMRFDVSDMGRMRNTLSDLRVHVGAAKREFFEQVGQDFVDRLQSDIANKFFPDHTAPILHLGDYTASLGYDITEADDDLGLEIGVDPGSPAAIYWADVEFGHIWSLTQMDEIREWARTKFGEDDAVRIVGSIAGKARRGERGLPQPVLSEYLEFGAGDQVTNVTLAGMGIIDAHFEGFTKSIIYYTREFKHAGKRVAYAIRTPTGQFTSRQGYVDPAEVEAKGGFGAFPSAEGRDRLDRRSRRTRAARGRNLFSADPGRFGFK